MSNSFRLTRRGLSMAFRCLLDNNSVCGWDLWTGYNIPRNWWCEYRVSPTTSSFLTTVRWSMEGLMRCWGCPTPRWSCSNRSLWKNASRQGLVTLIGVCMCSWCWLQLSVFMMDALMLQGNGMRVVMIKIEIEDNLTGRLPYKKTTSQKAWNICIHL